MGISCYLLLRLRAIRTTYLSSLDGLTSFPNFLEETIAHPYYNPAPSHGPDQVTVTNKASP